MDGAIWRSDPNWGTPAGRLRGLWVTTLRRWPTQRRERRRALLRNGRFVGGPVFDAAWRGRSSVGHRPERTLATMVKMARPPVSWRARGVKEILAPETEWDVVALPLPYSNGGCSRTRERGLRDPAVLSEKGGKYGVYATAVVLVQREMESWRSPLASIPPFSVGQVHSPKMLLLSV